MSPRLTTLLQYIYVGWKSFNLSCIGGIYLAPRPKITLNYPVRSLETPYIWMTIFCQHSDFISLARDGGRQWPCIDLRSESRFCVRKTTNHVRSLSCFFPCFQAADVRKMTFENCFTGGQSTIWQVARSLRGGGGGGGRHLRPPSIQEAPLQLRFIFLGSNRQKGRRRKDLLSPASTHTEPARPNVWKVSLHDTWLSLDSHPSTHFAWPINLAQCKEKFHIKSGLLLQPFVFVHSGNPSGTDISLRSVPCHLAAAADRAAILAFLRFAVMTNLVGLAVGKRCPAVLWFQGAATDKISGEHRIKECLASLMGTNLIQGCQISDRKRTFVLNYFCRLLPRANVVLHPSGNFRVGFDGEA